MSKSSKKNKSARARDSANVLTEDSLAAITSQIDRDIRSHGKKRKEPPTDASRREQGKRKREPEPSSAAIEETNGDSELLAEIRALGGDEEDLRLIGQVDSDDEIQTRKPEVKIDKKLKKELAALSKDLGISSFEAGGAEETHAEDESVTVDQDRGRDGADIHKKEYDYQAGGRETRNGRQGDMIFEPLAEWHTLTLGRLPEPTSDQTGPFTSAIEALKQHAKYLLDEDAAKYGSSVFASSTHKFLATIMTSGTLTDKVSALTLAVQESPVHNIRAFETLLNLASKRSRAQALGALGALVDLLGPGTLLPPNRRLRSFRSQPGLLGALQQDSTKSWHSNQPLPSSIRPIHLIAWAYENWLKESYFKIIQLLETWCADEIEYSRTKAVDFVYRLLKEKPEQEANLLKLLVNKLGDRDRKISSRSSYLLLQLQVSHPGMKPIIIRAVEQDILLHPAQDLRCKYYAINTLNQTVLSSREPHVAEALIRVYFDLFVTLLKSGSLGFSAGLGSEPTRDIGSEPMKFSASFEQQNSGRHPGRARSKKPRVPETEAADKLVSALLTGVNRAAPFAGADDVVMEKHLDTLFKIAHSANFNTDIQALLLIQHLTSIRNLGLERFCRTLYESLLDPRLVTSSKQAMYLNLLLRALQDDIDVRRVKAFVKRMLQMTALHQPSFVCGLLYIVNHLQRKFPDLSTLLKEPESSEFDDEESDKLPRYDGRKRAPEHSNAHRSCLWEIVPVQDHYHPSVSLFAIALQDGREVAKPDLESHTLIKFLDKFVYKNPKSTDSTRGTSIMQPLRAGKDTRDKWLGSRDSSSRAVPVNSTTFWKQKVEDVAAEDVFFHAYFQHVSKGTKEAGKKPPAAEGEEAEREGEEAEEDEIWEALVSAQPGIADDGSDVGFDDMDELDMSSEDDSSGGSLMESDDEEDESHSEAGELEDHEQLKESEDGTEALGRDDKESRKSRRKALKELPTFASAEDYEELLGDEETGS